MIAVIGAGIAGLSLAFELVKIGADVTVFDAVQSGGGASGAATSYLEPRLGHTPTRLIEQQSVAAWDDYADALEAETGLQVGLRRDGQLRVALPEDAERFEADMTARDAAGWPTQRLSVQQARQLEPLLGPNITAAAHLPDVRHVDGAAVCRALSAALRGRGVRLLEGRSLLSIDGARLTFANGDIVEANAIILAAGMGTNTIEGLPEDVPRLHPVRGVNLVFDQASLPKKPAIFVKHRQGNMVPRADRLLVGTTYDRGEESLHVSAQTIAMLRANAAKIMPALATAPLKTTYAGLRTKVADGNLCIGRSRQNPHLYMSLGHAGSGYLRVPILAPALARFVLGQEVEGPVGALLRV